MLFGHFLVLIWVVLGLKSFVIYQTRLRYPDARGLSEDSNPIWIEENSGNLILICVAQKPTLQNTAFTFSTVAPLPRREAYTISEWTRKPSTPVLDLWWNTVLNYWPNESRGGGPLVISHKFQLIRWLSLAPRPHMHFLHITFPGTIDKISHRTKFHSSSCLISWLAKLDLCETTERSPPFFLISWYFSVISCF